MGVGVIYGNYYLLGRLATGGMAEVFLGKFSSGDDRDELLAIKRILPNYAAIPEFVSMFTDEARIVSLLKHPNICRVVEQSQCGGQLFIAMEFVHGKDVRVIRRRALSRGEDIPASVSAFLVARIAEALAYAHDQKDDQGDPLRIVHRDVNPQNILLSYDGVPKLIDFGIVKAKHRVVETQVGIIKGKYTYMAPEQAMGQDLDGRTDIFALGIVLYELLAGRHPFAGGDELSTLKRVARADFRPIEQVAQGLPDRLIRVVHRAMAREPADRYADGKEMAGDLSRFLAEDVRDTNEATLSSFIRRLFRQDYIRETARICEFMQWTRPEPAGIDPADQATVASPVPLAVTEWPEKATTLVTPSQFLAAGFDEEVSAEGSMGGSDPGDSDEQEKETTTAKQPALDAESAIDSLTDPSGQSPWSQNDPSASVSDAELSAAIAAELGDSGETGTEALEPFDEFGGETIEFSTPESVRQTTPSPASPQSKEFSDLATQAMNAFQLEALMDQNQAKSDAPAGETDGPTQAVGAEQLKLLLGRESFLPGASRNPSGGSEFDEVSAVLLDGGESDALASGSAEEVDVDLDDLEVTDTGAVETANEFEEVSAVILDESTPGADPFDFGTDGKKAAVPESPASADASSVDEQPSQLTGADQDLSAKLRALGDDAAVSTPRPSARRPRGRMLTEVEIAVLVLIAALGLAAVVGVYWLASTLPLETLPELLPPPA